MSPQERWERISTGFMWMTFLFVAITAYDLIVERDDFGGVVMTFAPAVVFFGIWRFAAWRLDR
jgi:hypothetical protein